MAFAEVASTVRRIAQTTAEAKGWTVIVCPDGSEFLSVLAANAGGIFPNGASFSGRTALLLGGGRVTVVAVSDAPFTAHGTPYDVAFCGWGDDVAADNRRMEVWRAASRRVIS